MKRHDVVDVEADADALAERVVVMARHQREHLAAAREAQGVEDLGAAERLVHHLGLVGAASSCTTSSGRSSTSRAPCRRPCEIPCSTPSSISSWCRRAPAPAGTRPGRRSRRRSGWPGGGRGCRRVPLLDAALVQHADLVGHREGLVLVVRHQDRRRAARLDDVAHLVRQALAQVDVEVGERLVEQQELGRGASARASATRCCWPPESSCGYFSARPRRGRPARRARRRARRAPRAPRHAGRRRCCARRERCGNSA